MSWRGSRWRAVGIFVAALLVVGSSSLTSASTPVGDNGRTLLLSLPGPFNGCTFLGPDANPTSDAVLDLVRPSAFLTTVSGTLVGAQGSITSAELTSLSPETVVYTIAPKQRWSNHRPFDGRDLVAWWRRARSIPSVLADGYQAIKSMKLTNAALTVTATFAHPYADWNLLFRDVESRFAVGGCSFADLMSRPSLGPYRLVSASTSTMVLEMNHAWPSSSNRFGRIVIHANAAMPANVNAPFARYTLTVNRSQVEALSAHPSVLSHIGSASSIEELYFNAHRPLTSALAVREALSWSLNRLAMISDLWGQVTFSPSPGASVLFSQGSPFYPGSAGQAPSESSTTSTTAATTPSTPVNLADCRSCAVRALRSAGYVRGPLGWITPQGQPVSIRLVRGPSALDAATATAIVRSWATLGVSTYVVTASSEAAAAMTLAFNDADVALFDRPTNSAPSFSASSWSGPLYSDSYPSGLRLAILNRLYSTAMDTFNPVTARTTWSTYDNTLLDAFWARPLFTPPSLVEWSPQLQGVLGSASVPGFVDEVPTWNTIIPVKVPS